MTVCGLALDGGWVAVGVIGVVLGTAMFALAATGDWLTRRYERRETLRRAGPPRVGREAYRAYLAGEITLEEAEQRLEDWLVARKEREHDGD